jgi:hypothetical protein
MRSNPHAHDGCMISTPTDRSRRSTRPRATSPAPGNFPAIVRPPGLPRATSPQEVREPEHHHLPAWVRRAFGQARPILADQLSALTGDARTQLERGIDDVTSRINEGKFSQAFNYPQLISRGEELYRQQRREQAEAARIKRSLEASRRQAQDALRDGTGRLTPEVSARLSKALRAAEDVEAIKTIEADVRQALDSARSVEERRREREISRTKSRIQKTATTSGPAEDWQDVLRRLQEQMTAEESA